MYKINKFCKAWADGMGFKMSNVKLNFASMQIDWNWPIIAVGRDVPHRIHVKIEPVLVPALP